MRRRTWHNGALGGTPLDETHLNPLEDDLGTALLQLGADPAMLFAGAVTRDAGGCPVSATVQWPDGTAGVYSGTASTTYPGSVDAYTITYAGSTTLTITQAAVTRNASGKINNRPPLTIA